MTSYKSLAENTVSMAVMDLQGQNWSARFGMPASDPPGLPPVSAKSMSLQVLILHLTTEVSSFNSLKAEVICIKSELGELQKSRKQSYAATARPSTCTQPQCTHTADTRSPNAHVAPYSTMDPYAHSTRKVMGAPDQQQTMPARPNPQLDSDWQQHETRRERRARTQQERARQGPLSPGASTPAEIGEDPKSTEPALKRTITSSYKKPRPPAPGKSQLCGVQPVKYAALYVGGINPGCHADGIVHWCRDQDVEVVSCNISESKYFGTAFAHVLIDAKDMDTVSKPDFWPSNVSARPWKFKSDDDRTLGSVDQRRYSTDKKQ